MPIGELSRRVGVSPDLLRKWERRYAMLTPSRTGGNRRLYSQVDEARVRLMLGHIRNGMPASKAAELAAGAQFRVSPSAGPTPGAADPTALRTALRLALSRFDETAADQLIDRLRTRRSAGWLVRELLLPARQDVHEDEALERVTSAEAHFARHFLHTRLGALTRGWDRGLGPRALLACPAQERDADWALAFGITLHGLGWRISYLGTEVPVQVAHAAARHLTPRLTVLAADNPAAWGEVEAQLRRHPVAIALAVGGGAPASSDVAARHGALALPESPVAAAQAIAI
jgi:DNA-binding transcriptional MerR regulator